MTEVLKSAAEAVEVVYYDLIGDAMGQLDYLELDGQEARRYSEGIEARDSVIGENKDKDQDKAGYVQPPVTIMALIAACGEPDLSDFQIQFSTWYAHLDKEVLSQALFELEELGFIEQTRVEERAVPIEARLYGIPNTYRDTRYALTARAYELNPCHAKIVEHRQAEAAKQPRIKFDPWRYLLA